VHYSGYSAAEIRPVVRLMIDYLARREVLHEAFFKKYAAKKYMKASIIVREWIRTQYAEEEITTLTQTTTTTNIKTESQLDDDFEDLGKENVQAEDDDFENENRSDEDDYMFANELEDREVDEGFQMIR
jgi:Cyclin, C-terminal domain